MIFGIAIAVLFFTLINKTGGNSSFSLIIVLFINTVLYPYSRFVYESIVNFILGDNVFFFQGVWFLVYLFMKIWIMGLCWAAAIVVAPIGLIYLYFYHSRNQN